MPRPRSHIVAPSPLVPALLRFARSKGLDASVLALRHGLDAGVEETDEAALAPPTFGALLDDLAKALGDVALPLELARSLPMRRYRFGEVAVANSACVSDAMQGFARFVGAIVPGFEGAFERQDRERSIRLRSPGYPRGLGAAAHEFVLSYLLERLRAGAETTLAPIRVWFANARPRDLARLESYFATDRIDFGAADSGFALTDADGDLAIARADPRLLATVEPQAAEEVRATASESAFERTVVSAIEAALPDVSIDRAARALGTTPRTLQRRLEDDGTRFSEVLDRVREARARNCLLEKERSLADIAEKLGFADLASFGRAFKRWTGVSPGAFRRA